MQNIVNSNISWYEGHTITSLGIILKISKLYVQNIWQVVRWWHHQLAHLHIHIDWSRNVSWKFAKLQNVITSLFFNRFSLGFHCFCSENFTLSSEIKLEQLRTSPLSLVNPIDLVHAYNDGVNPHSTKPCKPNQRTTHLHAIGNERVN